jgi:hypothetical protein
LDYSAGIFFQVVVDGVVLGFMYALIALGYTMVYGVLNSSTSPTARSSCSALSRAGCSGLESAGRSPCSSGSRHSHGGFAGMLASNLAAALERGGLLAPSARRAWCR